MHITNKDTPKLELGSKNRGWILFMIEINDIKKILFEFEEVEFAYLFGSYARGTFDSRSDIDIAIYTDDAYNQFDVKLKVHHTLEINLLKEVDIVVLNSAKNFNLLQDILDNNIVLKESKDDARVMFELYKQHEILDYKEFKRLLDVA